MQEKDYQRISDQFKERLGLLLCALYALAYSGFVIISVWNVELMDIQMPFGLNLAVTYGMGLILFALILAFIYSKACNAVESNCLRGASPPDPDTSKQKPAGTGDDR